NNYTESVVLRLKQIVKFSMFNERESVSSVGFFLPATAACNGKLYVGEAAGFQDFLFGLGIRRSLQSGYLAARSLIESRPYDALWKNSFGRQLESGILNRFIYEKSGNAALALLMKAGQHFDFQKTGYRLQNPSLMRLLASRLIRYFWNSKKDCGHDDRCIWCKTTEREYNARTSDEP
ncbi:NAD(P)/FAD-dependent oxidoreductase, partial [candidate division KSB1 bacterium]